MNLEEIIEETFNVPVAEQQDNMVFMDMEDWDSMTHMIFITTIEDNLEIQLSGDEIADFRSIGDIKRIVEKKLA